MVTVFALKGQYIIGRGPTPAQVRPVGAGATPYETGNINIKAESLAHYAEYAMCKAFSLEYLLCPKRRALPYANMYQGFALTVTMLTKNTIN